MSVSRKLNIYDNPEARKLQKVPVPVMGGFVGFTGTIAGSLCLGAIYDYKTIIPLIVAMLIMLAAGAWDDIRNLSPYTKFIIEIIVVLSLAYVNESPLNDFHGLWGVHEISPWIAWPLTVVACVGIINAINMADGIDGLSSGFCIMIFTFFSWQLFRSHDFVRAAFGLTIVGSLIPFFIMNVFSRKAKMFIGDAGTMMLGIAICDFVMAILTKDSPSALFFDKKDVCLIAFVLAVLGIPVFDTLRVMFGRIMHGCSPFRPDKTHLHHAFLDYGFHHLEITLMEILLNMLIIFFWMALDSSHFSIEWQLYGVIAANIACTFGLYWILLHLKK
ncbi:MAG: undecaprenyl/decaprenyl-phosphate alpha-N-acetylglucosaminyl 1-phosphate transferase [Bacteroidales bacterium]|nr:undecaprenyl/decaprenyl-phosphate alpha-N-acetylglucosaminyl 1-phosphate transferase [Bacteroidales bacterium]